MNSELPSSSAEIQAQTAPIQECEAR